MKTILFCAVCLLSSQLLKAQFNKQGQRVVGGAITFNSSSNKSNLITGEEDKATGFSINANAGKFRKEGVLSSFGLNYSYNLSKSITAINTVSNTQHAVSAEYGKTWFQNIGGKLYVGLGGSIGAGYSNLALKNTNSTLVSDSKTYQANLNITPVLAWQVTNRFVLNCSPANNFLNLGIGYTKTKNTDGTALLSSNESKYINLNTGFFRSPLNNISFGFSYLLGQKKG